MLLIARTLERVVGWVGMAGAFLILPLILVTCWEVMVRHLFDRPTIWSFELGYMLTGALFLLAGGYALREDAHIRIDVIFARLSPRAQASIDLLFFVLLLIPLLTLLSRSLWIYTADAFESGRTTGKSSWNPPAWPFRFVMFLGIATLLVEVVAKCLKRIVVLIGHVHMEEGQ